MRIAINGLGRIGKNFLRGILQDKIALQKINVVAINIGPRGDLAAVAHGFKYDSILGTYQKQVRIENNTKLIITDYFDQEHEILLLAQSDPEGSIWKQYSLDWVVDSSGKYTKRAQAQKHLDAGAKNVLISAPADGEDVTIIPGVNYNKFIPSQHHIISLGSCTTNALVPLLYVFEKNYTILKAAMTTIHAYTNSQALLDVDAVTKDLRRNRAAAMNIVPTTTGAMEVVSRVLPSFAGKISGCALRVPVPVVSLVDLAVVLDKDITLNQLHAVFKEAENTYLKGILHVTEEALVSSDYAGTRYSVILDSQMTQIEGPLCKIFGWYDNEWAYSLRLKDFLLYVQAQS